MDTVVANLLYYSPPKDGSKGYNYINADPVTGKIRRNWEPESHIVSIENVRGHEGEFSLDTSGFMYGKRAARHTAFTNDEDVEREYYPESIALAKELTGASHAVVFDHTIRRRRPDDLEDTPQKRQPVAQVHVDQTTASAIARVHRHLPPDDAPQRLRRRFQIINLWRPISHPAYDWPLTLCDYRTVNPKRDLEPTSLKYPDRDGETFGVKYSPEHRWKYLRGMTPEEFVLIKCFDSKDDGETAILTPHTAFEDPSTPRGVPYRESIELRLLVFYD